MDGEHLHDDERLQSRFSVTTNGTFAAFGGTDDSTGTTAKIDGKDVEVHTWNGPDDPENP